MMADVDVVYEMKSKVKNRKMVVTTHDVTYLETPQEARCQVCPPDQFCPSPPVVEVRREHSGLTRCVRGYGWQMFALGFMKGGSGKEIYEVADIVICHRSGDAERLMDALHAASGPDVRFRIPIQQDAVMRDNVKKKSHADEVVLLTYAKRLVPRPLLDPEQRDCILILTETDIYEFEPNFQHWVMPPDGTGDGIWGDDKGSIGPKAKEDPIDELAIYDDDANQQRKHRARVGLGATTRFHDHVIDMEKEAPITKAEEKKWKDIKDVRDEAMTATKALGQVALSSGGGLTKAAKVMRAVEDAHRHLLVQHEHQPLSLLKQLEFGPDEEASLAMHFPGGVKIDIIFQDDSARESWREGLAYVLNRSDTASQWARDWKSGG